MTGKRVVSVLAAVALVVGAFVVRRNVIEGDDESPAADSTPGGDAGANGPDRDDATALYCITELEAICDGLAESRDELDIVVEDAGDTLDRLAALDDAGSVPLWLTVDPYPAMVDLSRRSDPVGFDTEAVAASPLAVAFPSGVRADALATFCDAESQTLWHCIGLNAGRQWSELGADGVAGTLRPSLGAVSDSALALLSFGNAVAGFFGEPDVSSTRFAETSFITWFRRLHGASERTALSGGTPLRTMATRPAQDAAATAGFELAALDGAGDRFDVNYAEPPMWIQAVLATPAGIAAPSDLAAQVTEALSAAGWDRPDAAQSPGPGGSTMLALRQLWNDAT